MIATVDSANPPARLCPVTRARQGAPGQDAGQVKPVIRAGVEVAVGVNAVTGGGRRGSEHRLGRLTPDDRGPANTDVAKLAALVLGSPEFQRR